MWRPTQRESKMKPMRPMEPDGSRRGFVHEGAYEITVRKRVIQKIQQVKEDITQKAQQIKESAISQMIAALGHNLTENPEPAPTPALVPAPEPELLAPQAPQAPPVLEPKPEPTPQPHLTWRQKAQFCLDHQTYLRRPRDRQLVQDLVHNTCAPSALQMKWLQDIYYRLIVLMGIKL